MILSRAWAEVDDSGKGSDDGRLARHGGRQAYCVPIHYPPPLLACFFRGLYLFSAIFLANFLPSTISLNFWSRLRSTYVSIDDSSQPGYGHPWQIKRPSRALQARLGLFYLWLMTVARLAAVIYDTYVDRSQLQKLREMVEPSGGDVVVLSFFVCFCCFFQYFLCKNVFVWEMCLCENTCLCEQFGVCVKNAIYG